MGINNMKWKEEWRRKMAKKDVKTWIICTYIIIITIIDSMRLLLKLLVYQDPPSILRIQSSETKRE